MNISSAKWLNDPDEGDSFAILVTLVPEAGQSDGVKWTVPAVNTNAHYNEIQRQVAAGTLTIQDAD